MLRHAYETTTPSRQYQAGPFLKEHKCTNILNFQINKQQKAEISFRGKIYFHTLRFYCKMKARHLRRWYQGINWRSNLFPRRLLTTFASQLNIAMNKLRLLFVLLMAFSASAILAQFPYKLNDYQEKNKVHTHYVDNTFQEHLNNLKGNVKSINQIDYTCVQIDSLNFQKKGIRESNNSVAYFFDKKSYV